MNEQKSFIAILALVVAAGLVLGTLAFSAGGRGTVAAGPGPAPIGNSAGTAPASGPAASDPQPSVEEPVGIIPPSAQEGNASATGEPVKTEGDTPPMQGAGNGDPPGTALGSEQPGESTPPSSSPQ
jgi:hypothetical protein